MERAVQAVDVVDVFRHSFLGQVGRQINDDVMSSASKRRGLDFIQSQINVCEE